MTYATRLRKVGKIDANSMLRSIVEGGEGARKKGCHPRDASNGGGGGFTQEKREGAALDEFPLAAVPVERYERAGASLP